MRFEIRSFPIPSGYKFEVIGYGPGDYSGTVMRVFQDRRNAEEFIASRKAEQAKPAYRPPFGSGPVPLPFDAPYQSRINDPTPFIGELIPKVEEWAADRNLLNTDVLGQCKQLLKTVEELGETAGALLRGNREGFKDGVGDVLVTLIIAAKQQGLSLDECLAAAWEEIKDRTGKTVDGVFVKTADLEPKA